MSKINISGEMRKSWKYKGMNLWKSMLEGMTVTTNIASVSSGRRKNIDTLRTKFGLQKRVKAENILNKQSQVPDK